MPAANLTYDPLSHSRKLVSDVRYRGSSVLLNQVSLSLQTRNKKRHWILD